MKTPQINELKKAFRKCLKVMYSNFELDDQLRDLARNFCMGWMECLMYLDDKETGRGLVECKEYREIFHRGWMPDKTWLP